jgi:CheY-like chemotaxis protein
MITTIRPSTRRVQSRRILWAEDHPEDIRGTHDQIRHRQHEIVEVTTYEASAHALRSDAFDLFVVDQQLPKQGKPDYGAGTQLVAALKRGDFGETNIDTRFVFVTSSSEWVYDSGIDVVDLPGFMGIEEKGGALATWFDRELEQIPTNPNRTTEPDAGAATTAPDSAPAAALLVDRILQQETWSGTVTAIDETRLSVSLVDSEGIRPDHEARLPREMVSPHDEACLVEGADLVWRVELVEDPDGRRSTVSRLEFHRPSPVSDEEIAEALARARARRRLDDFPDA